MPEVPIRAFIASLVALCETGIGYEVLLLQRAQTLAGEWCQIAGKFEDGETAWQAALHKLREETGLKPDRFYSADICEQFYEPDRDAITMAPVFVAFVDAKAAVVLNDENTAYRWVSFDEAPDMVAFGGQWRILRWIREEFIERKPSGHMLIEFQ
ncbi:NUDIX hydrolase [Hoeflea prorocentri]|uniref:NUDIX domain-containing protein n=1 Tax=Hoeflea prorocentri TaxID=1922333 RepID=A0A9X3UIS7_9HYPH|nr:NUDIX domain-containing protein [Hoeflea prorocentri]MCY6381608.1 NUDIX domain-containing protein [Hoeflea prorocentri]MDA5399408.1 NUDIX domain-containing protein [Hoeflea prorocentri]